ncbi:cytokinin hydroxylase-like [Neltuma alba]|uniref:cytokinin hydroxylase-like n=1 Tax=Neltuma alba TaxID=207710 RepID=UPI0010A49857|nr:cytokinin hydroxylase-like [Prosopis alba]
MVMVVAFAVVTVIVIFVTLFLRVAYDTLLCYFVSPIRIERIMAKQGVRGPKRRLLTGNIPEMHSLHSSATSKPMKSITHDIVGRLVPHFAAWYPQYGQRFLYWNGIEPRLCLTEMELIKEFLAKYNSVSGRSWQQRQGSKHFIGEGLLMANGGEWYHQRHIVAPAFTGERLKEYAGHMVECTKEMLQSLRNAFESGHTEIEISDYMTRLAADIISRTEFGTSYEKGKQLFHLLTNLQTHCAQASRRLWFPGSRYFPTRYNRETKSMKKKVDKLLMEIIESRMDCVEIGRTNSYGNDLLGILLNEMMMKDKEKKKKKNRGNSNGFSLNLQLIKDECKTFFFAGHETTALLLTWTVMLLASNPSWQDKVRAEVKEVCNGGIPSHEHLSKLNLLHMVINETIRLYPPAMVLPRMAFEDIRLGDLLIPKGVSVWVPVLAIHHSKKLWGEDADEFNPNRFASKSFSSGRFLPFAVGPRNCIGQAFALMEAKIILAMFISKFRFTISEKYRHAPEVVLTIKPRYGVQVCLEPLDN